MVSSSELMELIAACCAFECLNVLENNAMMKRREVEFVGKELRNLIIFFFIIEFSSLNF